MQTWQLPQRPEVDAFIGTFGQNAQLALDRMADALEQRGYVLGPMRVALAPFGGLLVESDRDPSADYAAWSPTKKSRVELAQDQAVVDAKNLRDQIRGFRTTINADKAAIAAAPPTTTTNIVVQFNALRDMMTHQQNGWLRLLDFLENQVMEKDETP